MQPMPEITGYRMVTTGGSHRAQPIKSLHALIGLFSLLSVLAQPAVYVIQGTAPKAEAATFHLNALGAAQPSKSANTAPPTAISIASEAGKESLGLLNLPTTTLYRIAACESNGSPNAVPRQFNADGSILWGEEHTPTGTIIVQRDCGLFQINTWAHAAELHSLGR